jgi:hypothetical protein
VTYDATGIATLRCVIAQTAPPTDATINAFDFGFRESGDARKHAHNVDFDAAQPTSCTQTSGRNSGAVPPLPGSPDVQGWMGTCRFDTPGTFTFACDAHPFETGTIVVLAKPSLR